jgi:enoyl-CoA hydratase/carnithine racemase
MVVRGGVGVGEAVPRSMNYVASMETLVVERSAGVLSVMLNRPEKKNAANGPMWRELAEVFRAAALNADDRVVVVSGAGGDFCSGADLGDVAAAGVHPLVEMRMIGQAALALHSLPKPVIAKVDGVAVGAGCNLALGCDLVVASEQARFSEIFARRGLSIDFGGCWLLPRRTGLHKAKELAFFADIIDAAEAERIGLVNRVVPVAELDSFVAEWAARLAAGPPLALSCTKSLLDSSMSMTMAEALEREAAAQAVNIASEDGREALGAFLDKRDARFSGR